MVHIPKRRVRPSTPPQGLAPATEYRKILMNKAWTIAASLLAMAAPANDAAALNIAAYNKPPGGTSVPILTPVGVAGFVEVLVPTGPLNGGCGYWLSWRNPLSSLPFSGNQLCQLVETSALGPGCPTAQTVSFPAGVMSVAGACGGYDMAGTAYEYSPFFGGPAGVTLVLAETRSRCAGALVGVAVYPNSIVLPITL